MWVRSVWERGVSGPGGSAGQPGPRPLLCWLTRGSRSSPCPTATCSLLWLGAVGIPRGEAADVKSKAFDCSGTLIKIFHLASLIAPEAPQVTGLHQGFQVLAFARDQHLDRAERGSQFHQGRHLRADASPQRVPRVVFCLLVGRDMASRCDCCPEPLLSSAGRRAKQRLGAGWPSAAKP